MKHLYVTDLDGTLLKHEARLSDYAREELSRLIHAGLNLTIATGRAITSVREILGDLPIQLPVICGNGAYTTYLHKPQHWHIQAIPKPLDHELMEIIHDHQLSPFLSTIDGAENRLHMPTRRNEGTQWYWKDRFEAADPRLREVADFSKVMSDQILSINIIDYKHPLKKLETSIRSYYDQKIEIYSYEDVQHKDWYWLSIYDIRATKANAISRLLQNLGMTFEQLTVFGDSYNDVSMFRLPAKKVAVSNAKPELLALADEIIGPNKTDSVVDYLRKSTDHVA